MEEADAAKLSQEVLKLRTENKKLQELVDVLAGLDRVNSQRILLQQTRIETLCETIRSLKDALAQE